MTRNPSTTIIQPNWLNTPEGNEILKQVRPSDPNGKRSFGILEKPNLSGVYEEVSYKLFFIGKSTTDKAKVVAELTNNSLFLSESNGIHKTHGYWPVKIWDKVILFQLQCWEASDSGMKKFSHILPTCTEKADALVFVFSFDDINSLQEASQNIIKFRESETNQPAIIVIGTRFVPGKNLSVSFKDIKEFESKWHLNVLRFPFSADDSTSMNRISPVLDFICEQLWIRDQEYVMRQSFDNLNLKNNSTLR